MRLLLEAGANPNLQDEFGMTALHAAVGVGSLDIARMLLDAGADATIENDEGETPRESIPSSENQELLDLLRQAERS